MLKNPKLKSSEDSLHYLYVSDTKINTLFEQTYSTSTTSIPDQTPRIELVRGSAGTGSKDARPGRYDKVQAVENYLFEKRLVGDPQNPKEYFKGTLPMRWGMYNDLESRPETSSSLVYFGGLDPETPVIVGLGGASTHVLGHYGATSTYSRSATPTLVRWIVKGLADYRAIDALRQKLEFGVGSDLFEGIGAALYNLRPPTQRLEFLARTLCVEKKCEGLEYLTGAEQTVVVLGSPLYVRQTQPLPKEARFGLDGEWKEHLRGYRSES